MQAPPVVRVQGIAPGSLEAQVLERQFAPGISHFIRAQRQNQGIGGLQVVRNTVRGRYLDVTYTRMHGVETVTIVPKPEFFSLVPKIPQINIYDIPYYVQLSLGISSSSPTDDAWNNGPNPENTATYTVSIGSLTFSDSSTASFVRGGMLVVSIYPDYALRDLEYTTSKQGKYWLQPYDGPASFSWLASNGLHDENLRSRDDYTSEYYSGPWDWFYNSYTRNGKTKFVMISAKELGVDLVNGKIPFSATISTDGLRHLDPWELDEDPSTWPSSVTITGFAYSRNLDDYRPFQQSWFGVTDDEYQRFATRETIYISGTKNNWNNLSSSLSGSGTVDLAQIKDLSARDPYDFLNVTVS